MAIPDKNELIGSTVTESQFKLNLGEIIDFIKTLEYQSPTFATTALLTSSRPVSNQSYAKALDTGKVWFWNKPLGSPDGNYWNITNLSDLDKAKDYVDEILEGITFDFDESYNFPLAIVDSDGWIIQIIDQDLTANFASIVAQNIQGSTLRTDSISFESDLEPTVLDIRDVDNNKLFELDNNLTAKFVSLFSNKLSLKDIVIESIDTTTNPLTVVDNDFNTIGFIDENGIFTNIGSESGGLTGKEPEPRIHTNYIHVSMEGQSLALGLGAKIIASLASEATNALVPNAGIEDGVQASDMQGVTGLPLSSTGLAAFNPALNPNQTAESPLYAAMIHLQRSIDERGIASQVLGSTNAHGGTAIAGLSKGTAIYDVGVAQSKAYRNYASAAGKSCLTEFVLWAQGETDISMGLSGEEYIKALSGLIGNYQTDINQDLAPIMLTYQTASHTKRWPTFSPEIPHAQLKAANLNRSIKMACAAYVMPYNEDGIHMPPNSYRWLGAYFGKVMDWMLTTGRTDWKPVQPEAIYRNGRVITIKFHVPVKPLVFDTTLVTNPGNYGFKVFNSANVEQTISTVGIENGDTVKIVLSAEPVSNVIVKYAQGSGNDTNAGPTTGARGNLRDSDATVAKVLDLTTGQPYPLQNWCPIFSLSEGFSWV